MNTQSREHAILNVVAAQRNQALDAVALLSGDLTAMQSEHAALLKAHAELQKQYAELMAKYNPEGPQ